MRTLGSILAVSACVFTSGCQTPMPREPMPREPVPRGHLYLPEDSFLTVKKIEALVPPGMPIEEAREVMESHGFVCTFEESFGIPYLQCNQLKRQHLWPFNGTWMATIYARDGMVSAVQARYDLNPVELGTKVPRRAARQAREIDRANDARLMKNSLPTEPTNIVPTEMMPGPVMAPTPPFPPGDLPVPGPASLPVEIP